VGPGLVGVDIGRIRRIGPTQSGAKRTHPDTGRDDPPAIALAKAEARPVGRGKARPYRVELSGNQPDS
jgi:hypothetical protein